MTNILALEDKSYYDNLIDFGDNIKVDYDGLRFYKKNLSKYDYIVSFTYNSDLANYIICKANTLNISTVLLCDGIVEWSNMFNNKKMIKNGYTLFHPIIHKYFFVSGIEENNYFKYQKHNTLKFLPKRIKVLTKKENYNYKFDFLITTANTAYFNDTEKISLVNLLRNVISEIEELKMTYCFRIFDNYLIKKLNINSEQNYIKVDIDYPLQISKSLISSPSSIILTAMSIDIPVGILNYRDYPLFLQTGWLFSGHNTRETLLSMYERNSERLEFQRFKTKEYFENNKSISDLINQDRSNKSAKLKKSYQYEHYTHKLLNSKFNFNFEYMFRKLFKKLKDFVSS